MAIQFPAESDNLVLARRVKMHEFLIPGGIQTGYGADGKMTYSDPIMVSETPDCPWHGSRCEAWAVIRNGGGSAAELLELETFLTELEANLVHRNLVEDASDNSGAVKQVEEVREQIAKLQKTVNAPNVRQLRELAYTGKTEKGSSLSEPFWALFRKDGSVDEATILCDGHQLHSEARIRAISRSNRDTVQGQWKRVPRKDRECFLCAKGEPVKKQRFGNHESTTAQRVGTFEMHFDEPEPEEDARDTAIEAFSAEAIPDEITFDDNDDEEDEK